MKIGLSAPNVEALKAAQPKLEQLKKATNNIEAIFIKDLLNQMQKTMGKSAFGEVPGAGIYQDLMNQALAESAGKRGMLGISKMLFEQLSPKVMAEAEAQQRLNSSPK